MAMTVNLFIDDDTTPIVKSKVYEGPTPFATFKVGSVDDNATLFIYSLEVIEKMQLELASLERELREDHGWKSNADYVPILSDAEFEHRYAPASDPDGEPANIGEDYSV